MGLSQMTRTELTEQDDAPQHQLHETGCVGPLWCLEESTHLSMNQKEKEDRVMEILFMKKELKVFANAVIEE